MSDVWMRFGRRLRLAPQRRFFRSQYGESKTSRLMVGRNSDEDIRGYAKNFFGQSSGRVAPKQSQVCPDKRRGRYFQEGPLKALNQKLLNKKL